MAFEFGRRYFTSLQRISAAKRGPPAFYELLFRGSLPFGARPGLARPSERDTAASQLFFSSGEGNRSLFQRLLPSCPGNAPAAEAGRDFQHWSKAPSITIIVSCLPPPHTLPATKENTTVHGNTPRQINPRLEALPANA